MTISSRLLALVILIVNIWAGSAQKYTVKQAPVSILWDVEAHATDLWDTNKQEAIDQWVEFAHTAANSTKHHGIRNVLTVPFWLYKHNATYDGKVKDMLTWALETSDEVVVMSYRPTAAGVLSVAEKTLDAADAAGKQVTLAVESSSDDAAITIKGMEATAANKLINDVAIGAATHKSFRAVCVHDLRGAYALLDSLEPVSTYSWMSAAMIDPTDSDHINWMKFMKAKGFDEILLGARWIVERDQDEFAAFLDEAYDNGQSVSIVLGIHDWTYRSNKDTVISVVDIIGDLVSRMTVVTPPEPPIADDGYGGASASLTVSLLLIVLGLLVF